MENNIIYNLELCKKSFLEFRIMHKKLLTYIENIIKSIDVNFITEDYFIIDSEISIIFNKYMESSYTLCNTYKYYILSLFNINEEVIPFHNSESFFENTFKQHISLTQYEWIYDFFNLFNLYDIYSHPNINNKKSGYKKNISKDNIFNNHPNKDIVGFKEFFYSTYYYDIINDIRYKKLSVKITPKKYINDPIFKLLIKVKMRNYDGVLKINDEPVLIREMIFKIYKYIEFINSHFIHLISVLA